MGRASFFVNPGPKARTAILLSAITALSTASSAWADYNSVILYPLTPPANITGGYSVQSATGGQVVAYGFDTSANSRALLWSAGSVVADISPTNLSGFDNVSPYATSGTQQVGYGVDASENYHALFWPGTTTSASYAIDLNPANYDGSVAEAVAGSQQVGAAFGAVATNNNSHAMLWTGTADSAVDLNPTNYASTAADGTDGVSQVGLAIDDTLTSGNEHAMLWNGTAPSAVDLNPSTYPSSVADSVSGTQQVGVAFGGADGHLHAMIWAGTAASAIDLSPTKLTDITDSEARSSNGSEQAGYGIDTDLNTHALLWYGSGDSAVDLQTLLPGTGTWTDSTAYGIDTAGHIYGVADGTYDGTTGTFAIEWLTAAPILGDANLDGSVDSKDFDALMNGFSNNLSGWSNGDFNENGVVNADDWALFQLGLAAYQAGAGISVPEPASTMLISLGALGVLSRRRRTL